MKHPRATVFAGAIISLSLMHIMASFFGYATTVIPRGMSSSRYLIASFRKDLKYGKFSYALVISVCEPVSRHSRVVEFSSEYNLMAKPGSGSRSNPFSKKEEKLCLKI